MSEEQNNEQQKEVVKQIDAYLVVNSKYIQVQIPFIPKQRDIMEIGAKRYIVIDVRYKETDGTYTPIIHIKKEELI